MCTYTRREIIRVRGLTNNTVSLGNGIQNVVSYRVMKVVALNNFFNVIRDVNSVFQWLDSVGNPHTIQIPPGHYDYISFALIFDQIATVAGPDTFTTSFDLNNKKFKILTSGAITPQWVSGSQSFKNISSVMGFLNNTVVNENTNVYHESDFTPQLIPPYYLLKSNAFSSGRKSLGGGGGTQVTEVADQSFITMLPNQTDGTLSTFAYMARDNDLDKFEFAGERNITEIDMKIVHPDYPTSKILDDYTYIVVEIEMTCLAKYK